MGKQERAFPDSDNVANPPVALAADKFLEARERLKEAKEETDKAQAFLIDTMNKAMQYRIVHRAQELSIQNTDPKQKIKVKEFHHKGKAGKKK